MNNSNAFIASTATSILISSFFRIGLIDNVILSSPFSHYWDSNINLDMRHFTTKDYILAQLLTFGCFIFTTYLQLEIEAL